MLSRGRTPLFFSRTEIEYSVYALINEVFIQRAVLESLVYVVRAVAAGGHLNIAARFDGGHLVVGAGPVGDDDAVKLPFAAEYLADKICIFVCERAVDEVVRGHYRARAALLYGDFEGGEINFAQSSLIHNGIGDHAALFLVVARKVLYAGRSAVFLNAADI